MAGQQEARKQAISIPVVEPQYKLVKVRDYSYGSLRLAIARCGSPEELEQVRAHIVELMTDPSREERPSMGTLRKLEKAGKRKYEELQGRAIVLPPERGGLILPGGGGGAVGAGGAGGGVVGSGGGIILP